MNIVCPDCGYARQVPDEKLPPKAAMATCPKCGSRFKFREISPTTPEPAPVREVAGAGEADRPDPVAAPVPDPPAEPLEPGSFREPARSTTSSGQDDPKPTKYDLTDPEELETPLPSKEEEDIWSRLESFDDPKEEDDTPPPTSPRETGDVPWENLEQHGFFRGFMLTAKKVMRHPVTFFSAMPVGGGYGKPLVFYLLIAELQAVAQFIWQISGLLPPMNDMQGGGMIGLGLMGFGSALTLVMYPVMLTLMLFFIVGINHICLTLLKASNKGFEGTFRAVTYGSAPMLLSIFPIFGSLIGALWSMVSTFFGYRQIHGTTTLRVVLAMLLPVLILTGVSLVMVTGSYLGFLS